MHSPYTDTNNSQNQYMNYPTLVQLLSTNITPETRSNVLLQLTQMNNQLLSQQQFQFQNQSQSQSQVQPLHQFDLARPTPLNYRKKDAVELVHPSMEQNPRHMNSMPRPDFNFKPPHNNNPMGNYQQPIPDLNRNLIPPNKSNQFIPTKNVPKKKEPELDLDDILKDINSGSDDISDEETELDLKLKQLMGLKQKIVNDSRRRKKERGENK